MTQENALRTLKDFDDNHCSGCECMGNEDECKTISEPLLRDEAIKWIKYYQECKNGQHDQDTSINFKMIYRAEKWVKHFFNITDEELKNG